MSVYLFKCPYPWPAKGQEPPFVPVLSIDKEQSSDHHEHPHYEVDDVQHVVEAHRVLYSQSNYHCHEKRNEEGQQVWVWLLPFA